MAKTPVSPLTRVGVETKEVFGEAASHSMSKIIDLAQIGYDGEPKIEGFRALTALSRALITAVKEVQIPFKQTKKGYFMGYAPLSQC